MITTTAEEVTTSYEAATLSATAALAGRLTTMSTTGSVTPTPSDNPTLLPTPTPTHNATNVTNTTAATVTPTPDVTGNETLTEEPVLPRTRDVVTLASTVVFLLVVGLVVAGVWLWLHGDEDNYVPQATDGDDLELMTNQAPDPYSRTGSSFV